MKQALTIFVALSLILIPQTALGERSSNTTAMPLLSEANVHAHKAYHIYKTSDQNHFGEILYLIELVKNSDYGFVRNGRKYNARQAGILLNSKFKRNKSKIPTAETFIEKYASFSGTSGPPYKIVDLNGNVYFAREVLYNELIRLRNYESSFVRQAKLASD